MFLERLSTTRDLGRLHSIALVLVRHGLGDAVRRLGMANILGRAGKIIHWKGAQGFSKPPEVHVREALEELGPTFVKVGQILAGRTDLLPPVWTDELARLHQEAKPVAYDEIHSQLTLDLGAEPESLFLEFDPEPLAAASIAQVHRARLQDGTAVVLKIRRPGICDVVEADIRLLRRFAEEADRHMPELKRYRPRSLVRQFARSIRNEVDLRVEAKSAMRLRANLDETQGILVPRIHEEFTRESLCVMDYVEGPTIAAWLASDRAEPYDGSTIAAQGASTVLRTVFMDGYYHADPHPGNVIMMADGRLGLIDFGMMGSLSDTRRGELLELLLAVVARDVNHTVTILMGWADGRVDEDLLAQDCAAFIDRFYGLSLAEIDTTAMLSDLTALLRENHLFLPHELALLIKVFVTLDGLGRALDPDFVMAEHIEPFAQHAWSDKRGAFKLIRAGFREVGALVADLPQDLRQLIKMARRGRIHLDLDLERLDHFGNKIDRSASRITLGLVTAALIVGTSIALTVPGGPRILGLPMFGFFGFASSMVAGMALLWSIVRSR